MHGFKAKRKKWGLKAIQLLLRQISKVINEPVATFFRCDGGFPSAAWVYFDRDGIVTGGPYNSSQVIHYDLAGSDLTMYIISVL